MICLKPDTSAVIGKLNGIAENVDQYFPDSNRISLHIWILHLSPADCECQIPIEQKSVGDIQHGIRNFGNINGHRRIFHFSALDSANIQHIVDKGQQMFGTFFNLQKAILNFRLRAMLQRNIGKANDCIHRSSNIMGHIIKEGCFSDIRTLRLFD